MKIIEAKYFNKYKCQVCGYETEKDSTEQLPECVCCYFSRCRRVIMDKIETNGMEGQKNSRHFCLDGKITIKNEGKNETTN